MAPKQTRLDDSAEIYKHREPVSEREKLRDLDFPGKVEYFKNYYLMKVLAVLLGVGIVVWILITVLSPKKEKILSFAFVNFPISQEDIDKVTADMSERLNMDEETQTIFFDTGYDLKNNDAASVEKLATYIFAGEIDILIAPESEFKNYALAGTMYAMTDLLPTDLYSSLNQKDLLICKTRENEDETIETATGPEDVYGIYIDDLPMFEYFTKQYIESDPPVLGIIVNTEHSENTIELIRYFLEQKTAK